MPTLSQQEAILRSSVYNVFYTIAAADPTTDDDRNKSFLRGSRWINTSTNEEFVCTSNEPTAAVWSSTTSYIIDASAGAVTLTLPATPTVGDVVGVVIANADNTVTIARNGKLLIGLAENTTISSAGDGVQLVFTGNAFGWATATELTSTGGGGGGSYTAGEGINITGPVVSRVRYIHTQAVANTTWTVTHNLGYIPTSVTVLDTGGTVCYGGITHDSINQCTITFGFAFGGSAYIE
jgi:hypothetical protein